jgi:hypothetical protein
MSNATDWFPNARQNQVNLSVVWDTVLNEPFYQENRGSGTKAEAWGIPQKDVEELKSLGVNAARVLALAQSKKTRTDVVNEQVKTVFAALEEKMRAIKRKYFFVPPLANADLVALGLKVPVKHASRSGEPAGIVAIEIRGRGLHKFKLRFVLVEGDPNDPPNCARRLWYKVVAPGEKPPENPEELTKSVPVNRKYEDLDLDYGDSGKMIYMAVQLEKGKKKGPWGPMISAVIP